MPIHSESSNASKAISPERRSFRLFLAFVMLGTLTIANAHDHCILDDFSTLLEDARTDGIISGEAGPCTDREEERSYLTVAQGFFMPFDVIDNDFNGSFCIGFLVDTHLSNTAPLVYFHDAALGILGNITVEGGAPGSVIVDIKGNVIVFGTVETVGFKRFQLCREGNRMTLYDGCTAVETLPFPDVDLDFGDKDSIGLLRDITSLQPVFQNGVTHFYLLSCTGPCVTQAGMAQVQCDSSPIDCDEPFVPLDTAVQAYVASLVAEIPTPTICQSTTQISTTVIANVTSGECCECARGSNEVPGKRENDPGCISTIIGVSAASLLMTVTLTIIILTQCLLMVRMRKSKDVVQRSEIYTEVMTPTTMKSDVPVTPNEAYALKSDVPVTPNEAYALQSDVPVTPNEAYALQKMANTSEETENEIVK